MTHPGIGSGGKAPALKRVQTVALYDQKNGRIVHLHSVITFAGGADVTDEQAIEAALRQASRRHQDPSVFGIALSHDPEHGRRLHRIDVKTKAFLPLPTYAQRTASKRD